jgi:transcriptional regulator with XRE-family HTH domain
MRNLISTVETGAVAEPDGKALPIRALRSARGETLEEFGRKIGVNSKGRMSRIERGELAPTADQALAIEALSDGHIDASALNPIIAKARGVDVVNEHGAPDSAAAAAASRGKSGDNFPPRVLSADPDISSAAAPLAVGADPGSDGSASGESAYDQAEAAE